jgi:hypothetical protein
MTKARQSQPFCKHGGPSMLKTFFLTTLILSSNLIAPPRPSLAARAAQDDLPPPHGAEKPENLTKPAARTPQQVDEEATAQEKEEENK